MMNGNRKYVCLLSVSNKQLFMIILFMKFGILCNYFPASVANIYSGLYCVILFYLIFILSFKFYFCLNFNLLCYFIDLCKHFLHNHFPAFVANIYSDLNLFWNPPFEIPT